MLGAILFQLRLGRRGVPLGPWSLSCSPASPLPAAPVHSCLGTRTDAVVVRIHRSAVTSLPGRGQNLHYRSRGPQSGVSRNNRRGEGSSSRA